jgi:hypothetical protein
MPRIGFRTLYLGFVTLALETGTRADIAQWDFDDTLESTTGQAELAPGGTTDFELTTQTIGGAEAGVAHFQRGTHFHAAPGMPPNGGGAYVNQYTLVMDVMLPDRSPSGGWASLFQTNGQNANDGDWFVNPAGAIGIDGVYGGSVPEGEWHRLALVVNLAAGTYTTYVDGVQAQELTGQLLDDRYSLYSVNDGGLDGFFVFADESGDDAEGYVNSLQFRDVALAPADIAALGGPSADGIPIPADPRDCSNRNFLVAYDRAANRVDGTWLSLPGENGFKVFQGARQIGGNLPSTATSFTDSAPPLGGVDVVYTLQPLRTNGTVERECPAAPLNTFGCIGELTCCADQSSRRVTLAWQPPANITVSGFRVSRGGAVVGTAGPADASFTDTTVTAAGVYSYTVEVLSGGNPACSLDCRVTVTGVPILPAGTCGGVVNTYDFNDDLKSSTNGRDLVPFVGAPLDPAVDVPDYVFEDAEIGDQPAVVCRYSRGTFFRLYTGMNPNGGGAYTNQFTLLMDVQFEAGQLDESGWASLFQTNEANGNDGDWFVRGEDHSMGIDGVYGGQILDDEWHRLALVVDLAAGTYTTYVNGVLAQQNTNQELDGRFALYSLNDGDFEGISLFADDSGDSSAGLVNSVSIRDVALTADEVAAFAGPSAGGIPPTAPCPHALACAVNQAAKTVTLTWNPGFGLPGDGFTLLRNGQSIASLPLTAATYTDPGLAAGAYLYELSLNDKDSGCTNLPLSCQAEIVGERFFFEDFDAYATDAALASAGWQVRDENSPVEASAWTVQNPVRRANPPTFNGRPTNGRFVISDSDFGGGEATQNTPGSGMSHDLWSPSFSTAGASAVWLHCDLSAQLNNNGDAVFHIDVSTNDGGSWTTVFERVSPARAVDPLPVFDDNADGLHGRLHLDLSGVAANQASVRLRFRHLEPTWDWWVALDNVLVDGNPADAGTAVILPREGFATAIPATWRVVSGPGSDSLGPWSREDTCNLSLAASGGVFPDIADGRQLHHLGGGFALVNSQCAGSLADEYLITPVLNLSGQGRVFLGVNSAVLPTVRAVAEILLSLDGGATFLPAPLFSYNAGGLSGPEEEPSYDELIIEAPGAAGKANVAFAFHYRSLQASQPTGAWWAVSDVTVTGVPSVGGVPFRRADSNADGALNITDPINTLNYLFLASGRIPCLEAANANNDPNLNITDPIYSLNFSFSGGPPPPAPGPVTCGPNPVDSPSQLGCESYDRCN